MKFQTMVASHGRSFPNIRLQIGIVASSLMLVGCSQPTSKVEANVAEQDVSTNSLQPAAAEAPKPKPGAPAVVIEGEGLRLIDPETTHATPLPFGMAKDMLVHALSLGMAGPPDTTGTNSDCGPGPLAFATWNKGLTTYFSDGKFVGWSGAVDLKTASGIGFGSTRAQLDAAYHPKVEHTSLGTEFEAGGISGVLESDRPDAAISDVWAGMTCVAR